MSDRKVILYIAMSLDGYIAKPDDDISFLSIVEQEGQDYGYANFIKNVDTVILGRKTFDKVLSMGFEFPHADKKVFVITRNPKANYGSVRFYSGDLTELVSRLKNETGENIFVDGGSMLVSEMMKLNLIDEFYISVIPIVLGDGISLFKQGLPELKLKLLSSKSFEKGLVQLHYVRAENNN